MIITGRDDVEVTAAGILYGRSLITRFEFDKLSFISLLLTRSAAAFGRGYPVAALWASVLGAAIRSSPRAEPVTGDRGARTQLAEVCRRLNGCRSLVIALAEEQMPALAIRAAERRLTAGDRLMLQELRDSLDGIRLPPWVTRAGEVTEEAGPAP